MSEFERIQEKLRSLSCAETQKSATTPLVSPEAVKKQLQRGKAIYGPDNRVESAGTAQVPEQVIRAVCILVESSTELKPSDDGFMLQTNLFGDVQNLCPGQRFSNQPVFLGIGTAFLVSDDTLVTAGHCVTPDRVNQISAIFDFEMGEDDAQPKLTRRTSDVYKVTKIHSRVYEETGADYAIVGLDRPVKNITPLPIYKEGISLNAAVYCVGHPCGLPKKVAIGAKVLDNSPSTHFVTNLDTFAGNSGSPVLTESDEVCGILVRGAKDFVMQGDCRVATRFPLTKSGEEVCGSSVWGELILEKGKLDRLSEGRADGDTPQSVRKKIKGIAKQKGISEERLVKAICVDVLAPIDVHPVGGNERIDCANKLLEWANANERLKDVMEALDNFD